VDLADWVQPEADSAHEQSGRAGAAVARHTARYGCATVATLAIAFLTCSGLVLVQCTASGQPAAQKPVPVPIIGSVVLRSNGESIIYDDPNAACRSPSIQATESASQVRLSLSETDQGLALCIRNPVKFPPAEVTLAKPLASRDLRDAATGRLIPVFRETDAMTLGAASGWMPLFDGGDGLSTSLPFFGGPNAAVIVQSFRQGRIGSDPRAPSLLVVQVVGGGWNPPAGTRTTAVVVRGHPGLAAPGILVWVERSRTVAIIGYVPALPSMGGRNQPMPFTTAALESIAAKLGGGR
jgi:hypothetical protein